MTPESGPLTKGELFKRLVDLQTKKKTYWDSYDEILQMSGALPNAFLFVGDGEVSVVWRREVVDE